MNFVEIFCGSGTLTKEFEKAGHNVFSIDIRKRKGICEPHLRKDVLAINREDIPFNKVHVLWLSPPCDVWSYAAGSHHWHKDGTPKTEKCMLHIEILKKSLTLIEELSPDYFFIENPRGRLRKYVELTDFLKKYLAVEKSLTYSSYGFPTTKPTNLFTNALNYNPRPMAKFGRGAKNNCAILFDNMTKCQRQKVPGSLAKEIREFCEKAIKNHNLKIGLYNLEPKIYNTALIQVSQYYKEKGHSVEMYNPLFHSSYDKIYAFSIFDYSDKSYVTNNMILGGSGFDLKSRLPKEIEACNLDYSVYPRCKTSFIWFSRGCIRNCPFCIVRAKEGYIRPVTPKNLNPNGEYITVNDNNFFANPNWQEAIVQLIKWGLPVDFQCGIDIRLFNDEQGQALQKLRFYKQLPIAWDNPKDDVIGKIKHLLLYIKPYKVKCYVLIGFWSTPEQDLYRVMTLRKLGVDPFVMPYNRNIKYQIDFARWVNRKWIFKSVPWEQYKKKIAIEDNLKQCSLVGWDSSHALDLDKEVAEVEATIYR